MVKKSEISGEIAPDAMIILEESRFLLRMPLWLAFGLT